MTTPEEIKAEYTSSLADLTFNSKPLINVLTMLAEENLPNAKIIVEAIEEHLAKVATDVKLPILYLIDCIVKNVGQTYTGLFSQNIASTFCNVFKVVDEKTRLEMFKLRQTWNEVFPQMKLYAIDVQIHQIDPAWPVTAHPATNSIHLNPKFLKNNPTPTKSNLPVATTDTASSAMPAITGKPGPADIDKETLLMQEQLIQKQKELLELQRKTLELEVLQTQVKLQEQMKAGVGTPISKNILLKPEVAKQLIPDSMTKTRPTGIANSLNQRVQNNQPKINPVNPALVAARPIRDPRLLRQQQQQQQKIQQQQPKQQQQQQNSPQRQQKVVTSQQAAVPSPTPEVVSTTTSVPAQKTAVLENNKNVTNKIGVRDIPKDPRLSSKIDRKVKNVPKSRDQPSAPSDIGPGTPPPSQKPDKSARRSDLDKSTDGSPAFNSSSSSSLASVSSSSLDSPTKSRRSSKHKKRDKAESKRSHDFDNMSSSKREKVSKEESSSSKYNESSKSTIGDTSSTFKSVKTKNRNYMRRNLTESPVPLKDEDLRDASSQSEKSNEVQLEDAPSVEQKPPEVSVTVPAPTTKSMDVDLRQLPQALNKKRASIEASDQPSKKSRSIDVLFGSEDTDLRQLPVQQAEPERKTSAPAVIPPSTTIPVAVERPPTPPPPIISSEKTVEQVEEKPLPVSPKKSDLDAVRAKLANATNRDKIIAKSFHKNKLQQSSLPDQDLRPKIPPKITISPEEEKVIKSGNMTKEQEKKIWGKILRQIEDDKLREAKIKDHQECFGDMSLQNISDEELGSDPEDKRVATPPPSTQPKIEARPQPHLGPPIPPPPMPFNDKDERLNIHHMASMGAMIPQPQNMETIPPGMENGPVPHHQQFYPRGDGRRQFRGREPWRGRGRNMQGPQPRQPIRQWMHQPQGPQPRWRGPGPQGVPPFIPQPHPDFLPIEDDASRSPGQDFGPQELTLLQDENKTLNIDGVPRDIRIYNETAIIFMNYDDPREISFQNGARRVIFNNNETYMLSFDDGYKECIVNGFPFRVKLGVPSREIFINDVGFECFFGGAPIHVTVSGINMMVALDGPPPQVKIGDEQRTDLVVGKINLIINAKLMIPVFLDAKVQKFVVDGEPCTLKFVDSLKRVLINDVPFNVEFGGLPKPFIIHGKKHFIRFSVLPKGVRPGFVKIKDMDGEKGVSPARPDETSQDGFVGPLEMEPLRPDLNKVKQVTGFDSPDNRSNSPSFFGNMLQPGLKSFDDISNVFSQSLAPEPSTTGGYQVELPGLAPTTLSQGSEQPAQNVIHPKPELNINELFQKLVASGFVKTQEKKQQDQSASAGVPVSTTVTTTSVDVPISNGKGPRHSPKKPPFQESGSSPKPQRRTLLDILKPVTFSRPETLKIRQFALYTNLYTGMQCSSCGMRFPPEASMWYSQHLDWHFRQNRRGKKNARVANSRKWYYSLGDWKNYEELEDLEEREKNYFDQQQQAEVAEEAEDEVEIPTVPADPGTTNERCHVCRDTFEQFFNEEKEEWHLRNAIKMDDKTYHPVCYEDSQQSILEDTSMDESKIQDDSQNKLIPGLEIVLDDDDDEAPGTPDEVVSLVDDDDELNVPEDAPSPLKDEEELLEQDEGDDDDVILNEVAPVRIVVEDDDDEPLEERSSDSIKPVAVKREKKPAFDDGFMDVGEIVTLKEVGQVKIKSEPLDDDAAIAEPSRVSESHIGDTTPSEPPTPDVEVVTSQPQPVTSHHQLITSIDGNIELVSTTASMVPTTVSSGTKIKINISKPLPVITPKEISESSDNSEVVKSSETPMEEPEILSYKPALQNVPLRKLPPVQKGTELTGLCSIM